MSTSGPRQGAGAARRAAGGVERGRWGCLAGAAARPPRAIVFAEAAGSGEVSSCARSPCVLMRLVPRYARIGAGFELKYSAFAAMSAWAARGGPAGAGRCLGSPRTARTARPPPGPRASLWEPRIFHPGPSVSIGRVLRLTRPTGHIRRAWGASAPEGRHTNNRQKGAP